MDTDEIELIFVRADVNQSKFEKVLDEVVD